MLQYNCSGVTRKREYKGPLCIRNRFSDILIFCTKVLMTDKQIAESPEKTLVHFCNNSKKYSVIEPIFITDDEVFSLERHAKEKGILIKEIRGKTVNE